MFSKCEKLLVKKLDARPGARTSYDKSSDLHSGLELGDLSGLRSEKRGIDCAIGCSL